MNRNNTVTVRLRPIKQVDTAELDAKVKAFLDSPAGKLADWADHHLEFVRLHKRPSSLELATRWRDGFYSTASSYRVFLACAMVAHGFYQRSVGPLPMTTQDYGEAADRWREEFEDEYAAGLLK